MGRGMLAPISPSVGMVVGAGSGPGWGKAPSEAAGNKPGGEGLGWMLCSTQKGPLGLHPCTVHGPSQPPVYPHLLPCTPIPSCEAPSPPVYPSPCPDSGDASVESAGRGGWDQARMSPVPKKGAAPSLALQSLRLDTARAGRGSPWAGHKGASNHPFSTIARTEERGRGSRTPQRRALHGQGPPHIPAWPVPPPITSCPSLCHLKFRFGGAARGQRPPPQAPVRLRHRDRARDQPWGCSEVLGGDRGGPGTSASGAYRNVQRPAVAARPVPSGLGG